MIERMIARMTAKIVISVLIIVGQVDTACVSSSFVATKSLQGVQYYQYSNNDDCTVTITPSTLYQSGYYLEIKWTYFDIEGSLPKCHDFVEIFLTR